MRCRMEGGGGGGDVGEEGRWICFTVQLRLWKNRARR